MTIAAGCVDIDLSDTPSSLLLDPLPTVTVIPTHVRISNGAGEVLVDQDLAAPYRVTANPPLEQLDGKLIIETRWDNGTTSYREVTHTPRVRVSLVKAGDGYNVIETPVSAERGDGGGGVD